MGGARTARRAIPTAATGVARAVLVQLDRVGVVHRLRGYVFSRVGSREPLAMVGGALHWRVVRATAVVVGDPAVCRAASAPSPVGDTARRARSPLPGRFLLARHGDEPESWRVHRACLGRTQPLPSRMVRPGRFGVSLPHGVAGGDFGLARFEGPERVRPRTARHAPARVRTANRRKFPLRLRKL